MKKAVTIIVLLMGGMVLCVPLLAIASGGSTGHADGEAEGGHTAVPWYRGFDLWKFINLGVLLFVLYKLLAVPILRLLHERTHTIEDALNSAEKDKMLAAEELEQIKRQLASAKYEMDQILEKGRNSAQQVIKDIISNSEATFEVIKKRAQDELAQNLIDTKQELQSFVAAEAVKLARKKIDKLNLVDLQTHYVQVFQERVKLQGGNGEGP